MDYQHLRIDHDGHVASGSPPAPSWIGVCSTDLVEADQLLPRAREMAEHYVHKPPVAVQMIKQSVNRIVSALDQSIMHMDVDQNLFSSTSEDRAKAVQAYLTGTTPEYSGN
jgi:enoyl-CoA hydratase/carnithine racemase